MDPTLTFYGAVREVTGSMHMIGWNGRRVLVDCGLCQGHRKEAFERNRHLPFDPASIDAMILTHAHIDHSGNLPTLVRQGYQGPIYATPATMDLCEPMLLDSAHIQEKDVEYVNKKRLAQGKHPFEPLYVQADAVAALKHFKPIPYADRYEILPGLKLMFLDAGHILGSAFTSLDFEADGGRHARLFMSGDMGRANMPILRDPTQINFADYVVTESTYGDRLHPAVENVKQELAALVRHVAESGGKLIIPSFSVGRTQELVYFLHELHNEGAVPELPTYVDSPLSFKATQVFRKHVECYDADSWEFVSSGLSPFSFDTLKYIVDVEDSKAINAQPGPMIIISASGMCESGRILHHLKHNIGDERAVILFVGFQAANTLGRRLKDGISPVRIFGDEYEVRARIAHIDALSAHADRDEMVAYFDALCEKPRAVYLVHGEEEQCLAFAGFLAQRGYPDVVVPSPGQTVTLPLLTPEKELDKTSAGS